MSVDREKRKGMRELRKRLRDTLTLDDIRQLCFDLQIRYDELGENISLSRRIIALLDYLEKNNMMADFYKAIKLLRPFLEWDEFFPEILVKNADQPTQGHIYNVPPLPANYLPRPDITTLVANALINIQPRQGVSQSVGLQGMGGIGKSVIASAIAWEESVREAFPDGIYWISLGNQPILENRQKQLADGLGEGEHSFRDSQDGRAALSQLLGYRKCLIVLDDVWELSHATAFDMLAQSESVLFMTTRNVDILSAMGAETFSVDLLPDKAALALLENMAEKTIPHTERAQALQVVKECGNLPLALAMIGSMVRGTKDAWGRALRRLKRADLSRIKEAFPHYPYPDLLRAIQVSVEALAEGLEELEPVQRYTDLAVFPEDTGIPLAVLETWWLLFGLEDIDVEDLVNAFVSRSLAQLDENNNLYLHDLHRQYVRQQASNLLESHNQLLTAYEEEFGGWSDVPNDGYFFQYYPYHLKEAGRYTTLQELLLNFEWLQAKLQATHVNDLLTDFDLLPEAEAQTLHTIQQLKEAIQLASHILSQDKNQLSTQLIGRLQPQPQLADVLDDASLWELATWLQPEWVSLTPPGGPLIRTLWGHTGAVKALAITPDGTQLLTGSDDKTLQVWELETGVELMKLSGHTEAVLAVATNGRYAVTASQDNTLIVWDLQEGEAVHTLIGHQRNVNDVAFLPNQEQVVSASNDHTLKLWDILTGNCLHTFAGANRHQEAVLTVEVSSDGQRMFSGSKDFNIKVWDIPKRQYLHTLNQHHLWVNDIGLTQDDLYLFSASEDKMIYKWRTDSSDYPIEQTFKDHLYPVKALTITSDQKQLITGDEDGRVRIWDVESGQVIGRLAGHSNAIDELMVTPNNQRLVSVSFDGSVKIWDMSRVQDIMRTQAHDHDIRDLTFTPDGQQLITASADHTLKLWSVETGALVGTFNGHTAPVVAVAVSPDGNEVFSASHDHTVRRWQIETQTLLASYSLESHDISLTQDGAKSLLASGSLLRLCQTADMAEQKQIKWHGSTINRVEIFPNQTQAISVSHDRTAKLWDLSTGKQVQVFRTHKAKVNDVAITPNGEFFITTSDDLLARLWGINDRKPLRTFVGHTAPVNGVCVHPNGRYALTTSHDWTLRLWDINTGQPLAKLNTDSELYCCAVNQQGLVAAGGANGDIHLVRIMEGQ